MDGVKVFVGGIIPDQDVADLKKLGVSEVFLPGAALRDIVRLVEQHVR
jgi:methylmalonyl-CoA mutase C-terminal domain/subunit